MSCTVLIVLFLIELIAVVVGLFTGTIGCLPVIALFVDCFLYLMING